jgi:uncharacterized membrane protein
MDKLAQIALYKPQNAILETLITIHMLSYIYTYLGTLAAFLLIDLSWLGFVAVDFYKKQFGSLLRVPFEWTAAFTFYALFVLGLMIFAIIPGAKANNLIQTLQYGAMFGFFTYMTYDLTNMATLQGWSWTLTFADTLWGTVLSTLVALAGFYIYKFIF